MSKLTLSIDPKVTVRAKQYAERQGLSVSQLVEDYLDLVSKPATDDQDAPVLKALRGSLSHADPASYKRHLEKKYR